MDKVIRFLYSFFSVAVAAFACAYFTDQGISTFYADLSLPPLTPENQVFPLVWSVLYTLMIISYYIVLNGNNIEKIQNATLLFLGQLLLQMLWTYLFFAKGLFLYSLVTIILLDFTVFEMLKSFKRINAIAAYLQYPYFLWLLFASYLNAGVVYFNGYALNF